MHLKDVLKALFTFFCFAFFSSHLIAEVARGEIHAITEDAVRVILYPDGRWAYEQHVKALQPSPPTLQADKRLKLSFARGKKSHYGVWYHPQKWQVPPIPFSEDADLSFYHVSRKVFALTLHEPTALPLSQVEELVLSNMRAVDSQAKLLKADRFFSGQREILRLKVQALVQGHPFIYLGYFYSGQKGTFQAIVYADQGSYELFEGDVQEFFLGLTFF